MSESEKRLGIARCDGCGRFSLLTSCGSYGDCCKHCEASLDAYFNPEMQTCPGCDGSGSWETECCNGAGGCSCRGERVDMGSCNVCGGTGEVQADGSFNASANVDAIHGYHFIGSGPSNMEGIWPNRMGR